MAEPASIIITRMVEGLRSGLSMNTNSCYQSIVPAYIPGQSPRVIQVVPGAIQNDELPNGGQLGGGCNLKRMQIQLIYWHVLNIDRPGRSEQILVKEQEGHLNFIELIHDLLRFTDLGGCLPHPLRYEGETATEWFDMEKGVTSRSINFSATFYEIWPAQPTLDLPEWHN